jgi:Mg/Co/Ni transporter MgtE
LGFSDVYDYVAGKLDWMAAGLPTEGTNAGRRRAGEIARRDVVTAAVDELVGDIRERVRATGVNAAIAVNGERVVFGLLRSKELEGDSNLRVEQAMRPGPSTFRPYVGVREMAEYMTEHRLESSPITTSDGRLVGLLLREDAIRIAGEEK